MKYEKLCTMSVIISDLLAALDSNHEIELALAAALNLLEYKKLYTFDENKEMLVRMIVNRSLMRAESEDKDDQTC